MAIIMIVALDLHGRYILVGHSLGGDLVQYYAAAIGDRAGGLVIVDSGVGLAAEHIEAWRPGGSQLADTLAASPSRRLMPDPADMGAALAWFGLTRLLYRVFDTSSELLPPEFRRAYLALSSQRSSMRAAEREGLAMDVILTEAYAPMFSRPHDLGSMPLICLAAEREVGDESMPGWINEYVEFMYRTMAKRSTSSARRVDSWQRVTRFYHGETTRRASPFGPD